MHSVRASVFRPFVRVGAIATPLAVVAMLLLPNAAFAATTIGSTPTTPGTATCSLGFDFVQASTGTTSPSYAVPTGGGSITSWSTLTGSSLGQIGLEVWRLTTTPATYQLIGASPLVTPLAINTLTTTTLATPIPVLAGDLLGLRLEGPATCMQPGSAGDSLGYFIGPNPVLLSTEPMTAYPSALLDVSATIGTTTPPPPPPPPPGTECDKNCDQSGDPGQHSDRSNNDRVADASATDDQSGRQTGDHIAAAAGDPSTSGPATHPTTEASRLDARNHGGTEE
jgi:hypothetical protein